MKKLLVLVLVLAMTQLSFAGVATLRVAADDVKGDYTASDVITLEIVSDVDSGTFSMDYLLAGISEALTTSAGTASDTWLHAAFNDIHTSGLPINADGVAVQGVGGTVATGFSDAPAGAVLWSVEFHIPDLPASTIIEISTSNFFTAPTDYSDMTFETNGLSLHIIPEPITVALLGLGGLFIRRKK